jgi:hypothetical protein
VVPDACVRIRHARMKDIFIKEGIGEKLNEMNGEMEDKKNANQARCYPLDWQAV